MTDEQEIKRILQNHEERIKKLESPSQTIKNQEKVQKEFSGLSGGIVFLIKQKFLDQLRSADEIWTELKREGYVYPKKSVMKLLSVDFVNNKKTLNRIKE